MAKKCEACGAFGVFQVHVPERAEPLYFCETHVAKVVPQLMASRPDELQAALEHVGFVARKRIGILEQQVQLLTAERDRLARDLDAVANRKPAATD